MAILRPVAPLPVEGERFAPGSNQTREDPSRDDTSAGNEHRLAADPTRAQFSVLTAHADGICHVEQIGARSEVS